eukprot:CAMPEP_0117672618 /NCGR_PEP_ID=MMETSP0804-20121206/14002_1 /TAXON_ID=1074897 /ORGANISM="Tetraselmis astigmatica, Strain CCMP880" /LENGTH=316 /DNA_ID=CAMNT_0005481235 /DNA_START=301 /DNA_END=1251 /DNA_ORIENTATION=+
MESPFDTFPEDAPSSRLLPPEGQPSPSSVGSELSADSPLDAAEAVYITHEVTKLDTLAGLAVRYGVSVSDIKRVNSLLSDSAMFARGKLIIPRKQLPVGSDMAVMVGMIVSGYGRQHPGLQGGKVKGKDHLTAMGFKPLSNTAMSALNDFYGIEGQNGQRATSAELQARADAIMSEAARNGNVEVELMRLRGEDGFAGNREGPKVDDKLRRRTAAEEDTPAANSGIRPSASGSVSPPPAFPPPPPARNSSGTTPAKKESFLERLRRTASQPVLATPPRVNFTNAAAALVSDGSARGASFGRAVSKPPITKVTAKKD